MRGVADMIAGPGLLGQAKSNEVPLVCPRGDSGRLDGKRGRAVGERTILGKAGQSYALSAAGRSSDAWVCDQPLRIFILSPWTSFQKSSH